MCKTKKDLFIGVEQVVSSTIGGISVRGVVGKILPCPRVQRLADCLSCQLKFGTMKKNRNNLETETEIICPRVQRLADCLSQVAG